MHKKYIAAGAVLAGLAVALGAFGAHGLKKIVPAETVTTFQTGVQYQMYHSLALLLVGILYEKCYQRFAKLAGIFFTTGIILFSGSLYILTFFKATETVGLEKLGLITPIGGLAFIIGWIFLLASILRNRN
jgi:uncharacterized membrane protein YgdD (TMEM256/DUF423 family)